MTTKKKTAKKSPKKFKSAEVAMTQTETNPGKTLNESLDALELAVTDGVNRYSAGLRAVEDRIKEVELALADVITKDCCATHREEKAVETPKPQVCDVCRKPATVVEQYVEFGLEYPLCDEHKTRSRSLVTNVNVVQRSQEYTGSRRAGEDGGLSGAEPTAPAKPAAEEGDRRWPRCPGIPRQEAACGVEEDGSWKDRLDNDLRASKAPVFCPYCNKTVYVGNDKCKFPRNHHSR